MIEFAPDQMVGGEVELLLDPVALERVEVSAAGGGAAVAAERGVRRDLIVREEIAAVERSKRHVGDLLQGRIPGLRIHEGTFRDESGMSGPAAGRRLCIQMSRAPQQIAKRRQCSMVAVYVDGVRVADPGTYLLTLPLEVLESVELIGPLAAGARYGSDSGYGVLEIHTRGAMRP